MPNPTSAASSLATPRSRGSGSRGTQLPRLEDPPPFFGEGKSSERGGTAPDRGSNMIGTPSDCTARVRPTGLGSSALRRTPSREASPSREANAGTSRMRRSQLVRRTRSATRRSRALRARTAPCSIMRGPVRERWWGLGREVTCMFDRAILSSGGRSRSAKSGWHPAVIPRWEIQRCVFLS